MTAVARQTIALHGHEISYRQVGEGPVVVLVHGITGSSDQWLPVLPALQRHFTVLAPDLLGHGHSAKPRGDYSLGSYASGVRDLLLALGHDSATFVGHSLGGGVAMQLAYQFPERAERLVLLCSGGLGREVNLLLRAAALPGADLVLPLIASRPILQAGARVGGFLRRLQLHLGPDLAQLAAGYASLSDLGARQAFVHTLRATIDHSGQRVSATDRLYLAAAMPALIMWGERDPIIPVEHGREAHRRMPGSRLELLPDGGHFPHLDDPNWFAETLTDFVMSTEPARLTTPQVRQLVLAGAGD